MLEAREKHDGRDVQRSTRLLSSPRFAERPSTHDRLWLLLPVGIRATLIAILAATAVTMQQAGYLPTDLPPTFVYLFFCGALAVSIAYEDWGHKRLLRLAWAVTLTVVAGLSLGGLLASEILDRLGPSAAAGAPKRFSNSSTDAADNTGHLGVPLRASDHRDAAHTPAFEGRQGADGGSRAALSVTNVLTAQGPVRIGHTVTSQLTVDNHGPATALAVQLRETWPQDVSVQGVTASHGTCSARGRVITCDLGDLEVGETASVHVVARAHQAATIANTATVTAANADPTTGNNTAVSGTAVQTESGSNITES